MKASSFVVVSQDGDGNTVTHHFDNLKSAKEEFKILDEEEDYKHDIQRAIYEVRPYVPSKTGFVFLLVKHWAHK